MIQRIKRHPLARALRIDKLTLAALEATLRLYLQPQQALEEIPVLKMFACGLQSQQERCQRLLDNLQQAQLPVGLALVEDVARVGGGAMPLAELPDWAVELSPRNDSVAELSQRLRVATPAVVGRVQNDRLLINLRSVTESEFPVLQQVLIAACRGER